jgi:CheY-like chemotaxis protein
MSDNSKTILIVDDEGTVRKLVRLGFEMEGYAVLEAENGEDAVRVFQQHSNDIDIVLLDIDMPKMNGFEALAQLIKIDPDVKVFFLAGIYEDWEHSGALGLIKKPVHLNEIFQKIRDASR